jgi:hypothetical protein
MDNYSLAWRSNETLATLLHKNYTSRYLRLEAVVLAVLYKASRLLLVCRRLDMRKNENRKLF